MNILMTVDAVRPGREANLTEALGEIQKDPAGNNLFQIGRSSLTHFVRLVLLGDPPAQRLLFVANFDGSIVSYLDELERLSVDLEPIFGNCQHYDRGQRLIDYVRACWCTPRGIYVAFPDMTVGDIRRTVALRTAIEELADRLDVVRPDGTRALGGVLENIKQLPTGSSMAVRWARCVDRAIGRQVTTLQAWERALLLPIAEAFAKQHQDPSFPKVLPEVGKDAQGEGNRAQAIQTAEVGAGMIQNQMTTFTTVRPQHLARLQLALVGTRLLSLWSWPPGEFAGVGTLHWFAWGLVGPLPGDPQQKAKPGRQLIFLSVFDGSWKNYMQDFIDKLVWGLDSLYGNTYDYPLAGMKDTNAFTRYIVDHQWPPQVFYSGYPTETVMNLIRDRSIAAGLPTGADAAEAENWLERL